MADEIEALAARLRAAAEARPMKLPVNRRVDESHHVVTSNGLSVWFTVQVSPHSRIQEAIFERTDRAPSVIEELRRAVGKEHVIDSSNDLRIFERDASIEGCAPDAVVLPANSAEVSAVIKIAAKNRIPGVPRGAGTGLSDGAVTIRGGIALQVTRMRRILEIDPVAQTALVEPGGVNQELSL